MEERSIIAEIEGTFASGSAEKQTEILRRVTDLFLAGAGNYFNEHVDLFDGVITCLAERIETKARVELAHRLRLPTMRRRRLCACSRGNQSIDVAGPILSWSNRLTDDDLLAIASDNSQERLLAISKRISLSEKVSDVLVTHGNRDVVISVTRNEGARFSDAGYSKLVDRSINDEVLAICVSRRKDIPREHFHALIARASEVVFEKLAAGNPNAVYEVHRVLTDITGQDVATQPPAKRDYREAAARFDVIRRSGAPTDPIVREFAASGKFEDPVAALSALCRVPVKLVEAVMNDARAKKRFCPHFDQGRRPDVADREANMHLAPQGFSLFTAIHRKRTPKFRPSAAGHGATPGKLLQRASLGSRKFPGAGAKYSRAGN